MNIAIVGCGNIGFETLLALKDQPHDFWVFDCILPEHLKPQLDIDRRIHFIEVDVTDSERFAASLDFPLDVMVCTVGAGSQATSLNDWKGFKRDFQTNFFGNLIPIQIALKKHLLRNKARVIVISSTSGHHAPKELTSYAPAKWALENLCGALRSELVRKNITVDVISPTKLKNRYSKVFEFDSGIPPERVAKLIVRLIEHPKNSNHFVPGYCWGARLLERVLPSLLDWFSGSGNPLLRRIRFRGVRIRSALITGASSALGRELAYLYSKKLESLHLVGRNEEALKQMKQTIQRFQPECQVRICSLDMTSEEQICSYVKQMPHLDLVVNNAGTHVHGKICDIPLEIYHETLATNFFGPVFLLSELEGLGKSPLKVINVVSATALAGRENLSCYSTSKAAFWCFTRSFRRVFGKNHQIIEVLPTTFEPSLFDEDVRIESEKVSDHERNEIAARLLSSREVAQRIIQAEESGREYLITPFETRLFFVLEALFPALFRRLFP